MQGSARVLGKGEIESGALAGLAGRPDASAVGLDKMLNNGQSKARATLAMVRSISFELASSPLKFCIGQASTKASANAIPSFAVHVFLGGLGGRESEKCYD